MKMCVALYNAIWKSYAKNKENLLFHFLFIIVFLIRHLVWNFVWGIAMLFRSLSQKIKKIHQLNSGFCRLFLQRRPETCGTHKSQQVWKGCMITLNHVLIAQYFWLFVQLTLVSQLCFISLCTLSNFSWSNVITVLYISTNKKMFASRFLNQLWWRLRTASKCGKSRPFLTQYVPSCTSLSFTMLFFN